MLPLFAQHFLQQDMVLLNGLHHPGGRELNLVVQDLQLQLLLQQNMVLLAGLHHLGGRERHLLVLVLGLRLLGGDSSQPVPQLLHHHGHHHHLHLPGYLKSWNIVTIRYK